jgi:hypothetical protein
VWIAPEFDLGKAQNAAKYSIVPQILGGLCGIPVFLRRSEVGLKFAFAWPVKAAPRHRSSRLKDEPRC